MNETTSALERFRNSTLSVVAPVYRNEATLRPLVERVFAVARPIFSRVEFILVNDGSPDNSEHVLRQLAEEQPEVKVVSLARNFGQHTALLCGMEYTSGEYVALLDADLEDPPESIPDLLEQIAEGYDIAIGVRPPGARSMLRRVAAAGYRFIHNMLADAPIEGDQTTLRVMTRRYADYLLQFSEQPFLPGFTAWIGRPTAFVQVPWQPRQGQTSYSLKKLLLHARAGLVGFSVRLLRLSFVAGVTVTILSLTYGFLMLAWYFIYGNILPGFTSIVLLISFLFGFQFILIGILGEYVQEIFLTVKRRPRQLVYQTYNLQPIEGPEA